jgi:hypothetical protein
LSPLEKQLFAQHLCIYCEQQGQIKESCPQRYPVKTPAQTSPTNEAPRGHGISTPSSTPDVPVSDTNALDEHALKIAQLSEIILATLRIMPGTTAGTSGASEAAESSMAGSRRANAQCFAQMSSQFFNKLNATHSSAILTLQWISINFRHNIDSCSYGYDSHSSAILTIQWISINLRHKR